MTTCHLCGSPLRYGGTECRACERDGEIERRDEMNTKVCKLCGFADDIPEPYQICAECSDRDLKKFMESAPSAKPDADLARVETGPVPQEITPKMIWAWIDDKGRMTPDFCAILNDPSKLPALREEILRANQ